MRRITKIPKPKTATKATKKARKKTKKRTGKRGRSSAKQPKQAELTFRTRGGKRPGAGRKPKDGIAGVPHRTRPALPKDKPAHIVMTFVRGLPNLRSPSCIRVLERCFAAGRDRFGFRLVHYSVQSNHVHTVVEADNKRALFRGMLGLSVRIARNLNKALGRRGKVIADRYFARHVTTPNATRNLLRYVLLNLRRHRREPRRRPRPGLVDNCSSAYAFDGFCDRAPRFAEHELPFTVPPRGWLLRVGWRQRGLIDVDEVPGPKNSTPRKH
jgi:REP element-mobilizing transposase RayT